MELNVQIFDENKKRLKRRKRLGIFLIVLVSIALLGAVGYIQREETAKKLGLSSVLDAMHYYAKEINDEDIKTIIYGKATAVVICEKPTGHEILYFANQNQNWSFTGVQTWETKIDGGRIIFDKTNKYGEWTASVLVNVSKSDVVQDSIEDCYDTKFYQYGTNSLLRSYIAYIVPTKKEYTITINGKTYNIELRGVDKQEK